MKKPRIIKDHIVLFSGGVGSWYAAKRVVKQYGREGVTLLFADTKMEDPDLYRFIDEAAEELDLPLVKLADGRDVWEVFFDARVIGNIFLDICSKNLKRDLLNNWIKQNVRSYVASETVVYFGFDFTEAHRAKRTRSLYEPFDVAFPLLWKPPVDKEQMFKALERTGIELPALYKEGFPHNNCGGFCVKMGQKAFKYLLENRPETYAYHEAKEKEFRAKWADRQNQSVMRDRRGGVNKPLTMEQFRKRVEAKKEIEDEWGGCGCV